MRFMLKLLWAILCVVPCLFGIHGKRELFVIGTDEGTYIEYYGRPRPAAKYDLFIYGGCSCPVFMRICKRCGNQKRVYE